MLAISSPSLKNLEEAINKFYYSENYFINKDLKVEHKISGKILTSEIINKKNRFQYHI